MNDEQKSQKPLICDLSASNELEIFKDATRKYNPIYFYFKRKHFLFIDTFENSSYFCTFLQPTHRL